MTSAPRERDWEPRIRRLEDVLASAGEFLLQASNVAQRNAVDIQALTQRVDSLTAASERHDRILDYLLRRETGETGDDLR
ncbi:MAG: hypothetical protein AAGH67_10935 [Cyanobacteria bacterium P01_H01_bin.162]